MLLLKSRKINKVQQQLLTLETTVIANQGDLVEEMAIIFQKAHRRLFGN